MEKKFSDIIIGFGKGGKTLAAALAGAGRTVALIERDPNMYGGTCINVACIPTKALEYAARLSAAAASLDGGNFENKAERYRRAISDKRALTAALRQKNLDKALSSGVSVLCGEASFTSPHSVKVTYPDGTSEELYGEKLFINTGSRPFIPQIEGIGVSRLVYTSETLMEREELPRRLAIVGGGYIGLEFASYFANFGSEVTIIQDGAAFIPREDREVAQCVLQSFEERKITLIKEASVKSVRDEGDHAVLTFVHDAQTTELECDAVLIAAGRRPNTAGLNLEAAGVQLTSRGGIQTDERLRTTSPDIYAMGDVTGGLQFTYISLDDYRIVKSALLGDGSRTVSNRGEVPYTVFIDPPLSRVGLSEEEARERGYEIKVATLPAGAIPKAKVLRKSTGMLKAIIDAQTGLILGAHLFCAESQETVNLIKLCMDAKLPYTVLRDGIFNHPTMSEALNDLFVAVK